MKQAFQVEKPKSGMHLSKVVCAKVSICILGGTARVWSDRVKECSGLHKLRFGSAEYSTLEMF